MLSAYEIGLLKKLATSYPNIYDTDALGLSDDPSDYIKSMLKLESMDYVEANLIKTGLSYVPSNPRLTLKGMQYVEGLQG